MLTSAVTSLCFHTVSQSYGKWHVQVFPLDLYASQRFERLGVTPEIDPSEGQVAYQGPGYGCNGWTRCLVGASNATFPACAPNSTRKWGRFGCSYVHTVA
jgi:hypothetical protein